tara:strand:+ start:321 stop:545 length:225 start_codon:yes stop_codon:yes gene_type:complete
MLELVNPPQYRHCVALQWLRYNHKQCEFGAQVYIQNTMRRVLGTAYQVDVELMTWEVVRPKAVRTQAVQKKKRL